MEGIRLERVRSLHEKGYIFSPQNKVKSVVFTEEGAKLSEELFRKHFSLPREGTHEGALQSH